jgi:hypothetical protein
MNDGILVIALVLFAVAMLVVAWSRRFGPRDD